MKKNKEKSKPAFLIAISIMLMFIFGILSICLTVAYHDTYVRLNIDTPFSGMSIAIYVCFGIFAISGLIIFSIIMNSLRKRRKRRNKYLGYTYVTITNYEQEIKIVRENFKNDTSESKNDLTDGNYAAMLTGLKPSLDRSLFENAKICYAMLLEASDGLFVKDTFLNRMMPVLPAAVIYSTDAYYDKNPLEFTKIVEWLNQVKGTNFLRDEFKYIYKMLLPANESGDRLVDTNNLMKQSDTISMLGVPYVITENRDVYITTLRIARGQLPLFRMTGELFPILVSDENMSIAAVDCEYWTDNLIANFSNGKYKDYTPRLKNPKV
ncbi:MAG: hypothetical protein LBE09_00020 [Christensenellaceae bacterium]|jgi:hypothetical protein|nr:hypothetical protein [Christensenellaceae bacterium]